MRISIKATGFDLTPALTDYVHNKLGPLSRFVKRLEEETEFEMRCEIGKTTRHHHKGNIFRAEANLLLPGKMVRAAQSDEDIRIAITNLKDTLRLEIRRYKDKLIKRRRPPSSRER
mgnify:CR=1 FL=1